MFQLTSKIITMKLITLSILVIFLSASVVANAQKKMMQQTSTSTKTVYTVQTQKKLKKLTKKGIQVEKVSITQCPEFLESLYETSLSVCKTGNNCREGLNYAGEDVNIAYDLKDNVFEFFWRTKRKDLSGVCWQIAKEPFNCNGIELPVGLISQDISTNMYKNWETEGRFNIDFSSIGVSKASPQKYELAKKQKFKKASIRNSTVDIVANSVHIPKVYYVRIIPMIENKMVYGSSNVLKITFGDIDAQGEIQFVAPPEMNYPEIYSVKIKEFKPIEFPTMRWGTVYIDGFDEQLFKEACKNKTTKDLNNALRNTYQQKMDNRIPIIPDAYKGEGSEGWLESLWNAATSAVDWVSSTYNWAKQQIVNIAAVLVDELPLIDCDDTCKDLLKAGLEAGMVALGVPPSIPNAEELLEGGVDYIAAEISAQVGCGAPCEDIIKEKLLELGKEISNQQRGAIANEEIAHSNGVEPMAFPNWVKVKIAPESGIQLPQLKLELKRNNQDVSNIPNVNLNNYFLRVSFQCTNKHYKKGDKVLVPVNTLERDGFVAGYDHEKLKLESDPVAQLWSQRLIPIPVLERGDKVEIPINLNAIPYLFPGHLELIRKEGGYILYDDWSKMYMDGDLTVIVEILGKEIQAISFDEVYKVLAIETMEVKLPNEYNGGYILARRIQ